MTDSQPHGLTAPAQGATRYQASIDLPARNGHDAGSPTVPEGQWLEARLDGEGNLLLGALVGHWSSNLPQLLLSYSIAPLLPQLLLICGVAVVAWGLRRLLLVDG